MLRSRDLVWDGCVNVRDLGGHATEDGGETRWGAIVRADSVRQLSDRGWASLLEYGVGRIVDLRWHEELEADPPRELEVDVVHVPLFAPREEVQAIEELVAGIDDPVAHKRTSYLECLERFGANLASVIEAVAEPVDGAVLVHCAGGVDRTGLVSALLLRLARVPIDAVAADYAHSERNWGPRSAEWIEQAPSDEERRWRRIWSKIPAQVMLDVLTELEQRHGSVHAYLSGAGVGEPALDAVVRRLRG